jgi:hypothetical protein
MMNIRFALINLLVEIIVRIIPIISVVIIRLPRANFIFLRNHTDRELCFGG